MDNKTAICRNCGHKVTKYNSLHGFDAFNKTCPLCDTPIEWDELNEYSNNKDIMVPISPIALHDGAYSHFYYCPNCYFPVNHEDRSNEEIKLIEDKQCKRCGQSIDWSNVKYNKKENDE